MHLIYFLDLDLQLRRSFWIDIKSPPIRWRRFTNIAGFSQAGLEKQNYIASNLLGFFHSHMQALRSQSGASIC
jgi:hypothetical protein